MQGLLKPLVEEGKNEKAIEVLDYCMQMHFLLRRFHTIPIWLIVIEAYFAAGATDKALEMSKALCDYYYEHLDYYLKQKPYIIRSAEFEIQTAIQYTSQACKCMQGKWKARNGRGDK